MSDLTRHRRLLDQQDAMAKPYQRRLNAWFAQNMKDVPQIPEHILRQADEALRLYKKAMERPADDPVRRAWNHLGDLTIRQSDDHRRYLPDPFKKKRGERGRSGPRVTQISELDRRVKNGETATTAAYEILQEEGVRGVLKNKADALVKAWKLSVK